VLSRSWLERRPVHRLDAVGEGAYSDYELVPKQVIVQRGTVRSSDATQLQRLVFTQWGGETEISGVKVVVADLNVRPIEDGAEAVFFLRPQQAGNNYELVSEVAAIFTVSGERVQPHVAGSGAHDAISQMSPPEFVRAIRAASAALERSPDVH
jgi:hypothetical protein